MDKKQILLTSSCLGDCIATGDAQIQGTIHGCRKFYILYLIQLWGQISTTFEPLVHTVSCTRVLNELISLNLKNVNVHYDQAYDVYSFIRVCK